MMLKPKRPWYHVSETFWSVILVIGVFCCGLGFGYLGWGTGGLFCSYRTASGMCVIGGDEATVTKDDVNKAEQSFIDNISFCHPEIVPCDVRCELRKSNLMFCKEPFPCDLDDGNVTFCGGLQWGNNIRVSTKSKTNVYETSYNHEMLHLIQSRLLKMPNPHDDSLPPNVEYKFFKCVHFLNARLKDRSTQ